MKVELILPITTLSGKLNSRANYYFRTLNGQTFAQRCPKFKVPQTAAQKAACSLFARKARLVAQMQREGSKLSRQQLWRLVAQIL